MPRGGVNFSLSLDTEKWLCLQVSNQCPNDWWMAFYCPWVLCLFFCCTEDWRVRFKLSGVPCPNLGLGRRGHTAKSRCFTTRGKYGTSPCDFLCIRSSTPPGCVYPRRRTRVGTNESKHHPRPSRYKGRKVK